MEPVARDAASNTAAAERWFWPVFGVLVALSLIPLWIGKYLPMCDYPNHLAMARVYHDLHDPASPFHRWYVFRPGFTPYLTFFWFIHLCSYVTSFDVAGRLFLTLYAAGIPLSVLALVRAFDRSRWLALFSFPLVFTLMFHLGFVNYLAAIPLAIVSVAAYAARLQGGLPGRRWDAVLVALPLLTLSSHFHAWGAFGAVMAICWFVFPGRRIRSALLVAPSLLLFAVWLRSLSTHGTSGFQTYMNFSPWQQHVEEFERLLTNVYKDRIDRFVAHTFLGVWIWASVAALVHARREHDRWRVATVVIASFVLATVAYLFSPFEIKQGPTVGHLWVYPRFAVFVPVFLLLVAPLRPGRMPRAACATLACLVIAHIAHVSWVFQRFGDEVGDLKRVAKHIEPGTCFAGISMLLIPSTVVRHSWTFWHFDKYLTVYSGASPAMPFAAGFQFPVALKGKDGKPAERPESVYPVLSSQDYHFIGRPGLIMEQHGDFYRYFLLPTGVPPEELFGKHLNEVKLVDIDGPFALFENPRGTCGAPAPAPAAAATATALPPG